ncbi:MAG: hypothetical protein AB8F34_12675 [Akkermansiaceae bacterium]
MHIKAALILILISGLIGYLTEPLLVKKQDNGLSDNSTSSKPTQLDDKTTDGTFTYIKPEGNTNPTKAAPVKPGKQKVTSIPQHNDKPIDRKPPPKPKFPITTLELHRPDNRSLTGSPNLEKAIAFAIKNNDFEGLIDLLEKDLYQPVQKDKEIEPKQLSELADNPAWSHALNVYTLLQFFSPGEMGLTVKINDDMGNFYNWLLTTPQALSELLYNLTPQDDLSKALAIMQQIWKRETEQPEMRTKYLNLAIACALVFDKAKIKAKTGYENIEPLSRYALFKKNAEAKRLKTTLSRMDVSDLVWVVDVPVTDDEIEWAVRHANFSRRNWGRAYGHIEYLMERAVNGENPYSEYIFSEIEKHGGICGDQTYFSANTAKANGIPATGVTGSGDRGGHAWLAYKPKDDEWDTTTGRYENYSNGRSRNSQTNQSISEFEFMLMSDRKMRTSAVQEAKTLLRFARVLISKKHAPTGIRQTLEEATGTAPLLEEAWSDYLTFLEQVSPSPTKGEWKKVIETIERTFKKHPTMWMTARALTQKYLWKDLEPELIEKDQSRYRSEIARKFPARGDLIRKVIAEQGDMLVKQNDFTATRSFYRQAFRLFGEDTLNFKFIAERYFQTGQKFPDDREQICDDIESYFGRSIDQESGDYFKAKTEIGILTIISSYYRQIGNDRKAEKFSKEAEKRSKKSSKRAL